MHYELWVNVAVIFFSYGGFHNPSPVTLYKSGLSYFLSHFDKQFLIHLSISMPCHTNQEWVDFPKLRSSIPSLTLPPPASSFLLSLQFTHGLNGEKPFVLANARYVGL